MNNLLADAVAFETIDELSKMSAVSTDPTVSSYNTMLIVLGGAVVLIVTGILILPKLFDRVLNLGPILGIIALIGAAVALPYSVYLAVNPTNPSTSADIEQSVSNIKFEYNNKILTVSWDTSIPALGSIKYGKDPENLDQVSFTEEPLKRKMSHVALVSDLETGTKYYFEIVVGKNKYRQGGKPLEYFVPK